MTDEVLRVGDVALDLSQGRPVQIVRAHDETVAEYTDYDLLDNYANERLGTGPEDAVFDIVYVGSLRSQPSKVYAFPESRLSRIEVEAASDTLGRVQDEWAEQLLVTLFTVAGRDEDGVRQGLQYLARGSGIPDDVIDRARELADVERRVLSEEVGD